MAWLTVRGNVASATAASNRELFAAQRGGDVGAEVGAAIELAGLHMLGGRFRAAEEHLRSGLEAMERPPSRRCGHLATLLATEAVLHALRGWRPPAEAAFNAALVEARGDLATEQRVRAMRASVTADWDADRAFEDSRRAVIDSALCEEWRAVALIGLGAAHLEAGNLGAAASVCERLAAADLPAVTHGRSLLLASGVAARRGEAAATDLARHAAAALGATGAFYWAAEADMALSRLDSRRREFHRRRAIRGAGRELTDPAWGRVLRGPGEIVLRFLGRCEARVDGHVVRTETRAEMELLAMLSLCPSGLSPLQIGDRLWPDDEARRVAHRVDNVVSGLRRRLAPTSRLQRTRFGLSLDLLPGECDVRDALHLAQADLRESSLDAMARRRLVHDLGLPLLGGVDIPWIGLEQARLADLARTVDRGSHSSGPSQEPELSAAV